MKRIVARWESVSGKYWVELYADNYGYGYCAVDCGGNMGKLRDDAAAIEQLAARVASGYFQPDKNKTPMHRV